MRKLTLIVLALSVVEWPQGRPRWFASRRSEMLWSDRAHRKDRSRPQTESSTTATFKTSRRMGAGTNSRLIGEPRAPTAACTPDCPNNHAISIEREVDVDGDTLQEDPAHSRDSRVARSDPWECGDQVERAIEIRRKRVDVLAVGHPPVALAKDVAARSGGEQNLSALHVERSSRKTSSALTRRPASRSPSDWRRASCKAARSASSSQSPGSKGKSSTSVPSGRSVGSSNTSRPARTRAFSVMVGSLLRKPALGSRPRLTRQRRSRGTRASARPGSPARCCDLTRG
jgi:hypothetical protein